MVKIRNETKIRKELVYAKRKIIEIEAQYHLMSTVADVAVDMLLTGG